jgi:hypothetical protein
MNVKHSCVSIALFHIQTFLLTFMLLVVYFSKKSVRTVRYAESRRTFIYSHPQIVATSTTVECCLGARQSRLAKRFDKQ